MSYWQQHITRISVAMRSPLTGQECFALIPPEVYKKPLFGFKQRVKNFVRRITGSSRFIPDLYYDEVSDFGFFPRPDEDFLGLYYAQLGKVLANDRTNRLEFAQSASIAKSAVQMIHWIEEKTSVISADNSAADFGSGSGWMALSMAKRIQNVVATDFSYDAIPLISELNNQIKLEALEEFWGSDREFDLISSVDVFEHLTDPVETLKRLYKKTRTGGHVFISVPNFNSYFSRVCLGTHPYFAYPAHLNYFTQKSLMQLCKAAGYAPVSCEIKTLPWEFEYVSHAFPRKVHDISGWRLMDLMSEQEYGERLFCLAVKS